MLGSFSEAVLIVIIMVLAGALLFFVRKNRLAKVSLFNGSGGEFNTGFDSVSRVPVNSVRGERYNFADIAGNEEAKESLADIVDFIASPQKYTRLGARLPKGIIFHGLPGTGKTLMAKAMAGEAGVPFFAVSGSDFVQMYVGVGAARVRELFKKARQAGKAVIFIDEIDALGKKRTAGGAGSNEERDQALNALLTEMSGFEENSGIVVVAATNRLDTLDDALLRPGRFDRQVEVAMPDAGARMKILELYTAGKPIAVNLAKWAKDTVFFSGAMLENLVNEAAILAAKQNEAEITDSHMEQAYYTVLAGQEKKDRSQIKRRDRETTAYHEAGHALAAKLISPQNSIAKVTIIPSAKGIGGFCVSIPPEKPFYTKKELEEQLAVHMAGRCAEELIFGAEHVTTGAANDIEKATEIAKNYIGRYGMGKFGLLNLHTFGNSDIMASDFLHECKHLMERLYMETQVLLENHRETLTRIAEELLRVETLDEAALDALIA